MLAPLPPVVVHNDRGGEIVRYADAVDQLRAEGRRAIIDGACMSACTLLLTLPAGQVCVTRRSRLLFHAAYWFPSGRTDWATTARIRAVYPPPVRAWIDRRGGLRPQSIILKGAELARTVPICAA